jgi:hypothetical protein
MLRKEPTKPCVSLMLDSGAYSAWTKKEEIDIDEYISYIKANKEWIATYVNLDVIPGAPGQDRTMKQAEEGAAASWDNFCYMRKKGLDPIPVFHRGENMKWLEKMLSAGCQYIGIAPGIELAGAGPARNWLDNIFTELTDKQGLPKVKTHGFAVASFELMKRYPWYTCDATSWAMTAAFGSIYVPVYRGGVPDYSEIPVKMTVSNQGKKDGSLAADHYKRFGPLMSQRVVHFLENEVGIKVEHAAEDYEARARAVVFFYKKFEQAIGEQPFRFRRRGFV